MRTTFFLTILVLTGALTLSGGSIASAQSRADVVNRFYKEFKRTLKESEFPARDLTTLVRADRSSAKAILAKLEAYSSRSGKQQEAIEWAVKHLQVLLAVTAPEMACDATTVKGLTVTVCNIDGDDNRIHYLERIVDRCPKAREAHVKLADLYLRDLQTGMAVQHYERAVRLKPDGEISQRLSVARRLFEDYKAGKPITTAQVNDLVEDKLMAPIRRVIPKVKVIPAIQRQILFNEWSSQIREEFIPELQVVGQTLKDRFHRNGHVEIIIEGHTDRRGPLEKNLALSRERAASVKRFLVGQCGVDPSRLQTKGFGPYRPISASDNSEGWALNRRVEFKIFER